MATAAQYHYEEDPEEIASNVYGKDSACTFSLVY